MSGTTYGLEPTASRFQHRSLARYHCARGAIIFGAIHYITNISSDQSHNLEVNTDTLLVVRVAPESVAYISQMSAIDIASIGNT